MITLRPDLFLDPARPSLPDSLLRHLPQEERDLARSVNVPGDVEQLAQVSVLQDHLALRVALYERLTEALPAVRARLANYDALIRELTANRLACLLLKLYLQVRLGEFQGASGLLSRLLKSREVVSIHPEWNRLVDELVGFVMVYGDPGTSVQIDRLATGRTGGRIEATAIGIVATLCVTIARGSADEALQAIRAAHERRIESVDSRVCEALSYLEACAHRQLGHPGEEFDALKRWRSSVSGGIGRAVVAANEAARQPRKEMLVAGARRLQELAVAQGDVATVTGIAEDLRVNGLPQFSDVEEATLRTTTTAAPPPAAEWDLFSLSRNHGRPVTQVLAEFVQRRRHPVACIAVESAYASSAMRSYPKSRSILDVAGPLTSAFEHELESAGDIVTTVRSMPRQDTLRSQWLVCARQGEPCALGVRLLDQSDSFTIHFSPFIVVPPGLPDQAWLEGTAEAVAQIASRNPVWHGEIERTIERAARSLSPSLAPLEISHGPIRELD